MKPYDLLVIGGGSAGFNAARVAISLGKRVAIADGSRPLGGLCILRGCMPSKTLIYAAEVLHLANHGAEFGLKIPKGTADMKAVHARKLKIIADFADHRTKQLLTGRFDLYRGNARFVDAHTVALSDGKTLEARHILVATGSRVSTPPIPGLAEAGAWSSDDVLDLDFVPRSVVVLGGGVVACELAQYLRRIGSRVTVLQRSHNILRDHSDDASDVVAKAFRDEGIVLHTGTKIVRVERRNTSGELENGKGSPLERAGPPKPSAKEGRGVFFRIIYEHEGKTRTCTADHCFNALGRDPDTKHLNLDAAGVKTDKKGRISANRRQQSSIPHIYAAGDCAGPADIVHVAIQQGELAARHAAGLKKLKPVDYGLLLNVVFTDPQLASIGPLASDLAKHGIPHVSASYPFDDHGKSILMEAKRGYVKVIAEPKRGRILGAEIVGKDAGELIHCFSAPMAMRATVFDMLKAPWYHPTLSEIVTYPLEEIAEKIK